MSAYLFDTLADHLPRTGDEMSTLRGVGTVERVSAKGDRWAVEVMLAAGRSATVYFARVEA